MEKQEISQILNERVQLLGKMVLKHIEKYLIVSLLLPNDNHEKYLIHIDFKGTRDGIDIGQNHFQLTLDELLNYEILHDKSQEELHNMLDQITRKIRIINERESKKIHNRVLNAVKKDFPNIKVNGESPYEK